MMKCMKKCRIAEVAVAQAVGVRTEARSPTLASAAEVRVILKRKKEAGKESGELQMECEEESNSMCSKFDCRGNRNGMSFSRYQIIYSENLESSVKRNKLQSRPEKCSKIDAEIEEFLRASEESEKQRFARRYNFDVDKEDPLEGRYDWVRINS